MAAGPDSTLELDATTGKDSAVRDATPARIGRFVVLRELGAGGMGIVYSAFDEELDRRVAIKLLLSERGDEATRSRMQREAQAMARLSHPNVVQVYEVGRDAGRIFVAMEYVQGQTLRGWQKAAKRSWRDVVGVYRQAALGLEAAHAVGLVHRDFKPDNVMLGLDGRVRVLDFGLARTAAADEQAPIAPPTPDTEPSERPLQRLTRTGAVVGTPAYMAAEQFLGGATDTRTDVFAFCVALYEALYGERPFRGATRIELLSNVVDGKRQPPPANADVPRWLHDAVVSGLAPQPEDRPARMTDLLAALGRDPARRRRRVVLGVLASGSLAAAVGVGASLTRTPEPCTDLEQPIRAAWQDGPRASVLADLRAVESGFAEPTAVLVQGRLDGYADRWADHRRRACEATRVRGEQSEARLDRAMGCLDDRRRAFEALVAGLAQPDIGVLAAAPTAIEALPAVESCVDPRYLDARVDPPSPEIASHVQALADRLARADAEVALGRIEPVRAEHDAIVAAARQLGHAPLVADAALASASLRLRLAERDDEIVALLVEAVSAADRVGDLESSAAAAVQLSVTADQLLERPDEAQRWEKVAEARLERLGPAGAGLESMLLRHRASRLRAAGAYEEAHALLQRAMELAEGSVDGGVAHEAEARLAMAGLLSEWGHHAEARAEVDRADSIVTAVLGEDHPTAIDVLTARGIVLMGEGRAEEALPVLRRAIERVQRSLGDEHPLVVRRLLSLASALSEVGADAEALAIAERAHAVAQRALGPDALQTGLAAHDLAGLAFGAHAYARAEEAGAIARGVLEARLPADDLRIADTYELLAGLAFVREDYTAAQQRAERVLAIRRAAYGDRAHTTVASAMSNLASVFEARGELSEAASRYREVLALRRTAVGDDHPAVARDRVELGRTLLALGQPAEAVQQLQEAARIHEIRSAPDRGVATTLFLLAQAEHAVGEETPAREHAVQARQWFERAGRSEDATEVGVWLSAHGG